MKLSKRFSFHRIRPKFFEGVYYKLTSPLNKTLVLIPGFASGEDKHAFIQVFNGRDYHYIRYQLSEYERLDTGIKIGENYFSIDHVKVEIDRDELRLHGELELTSHTPWPAAKGAMGPFAYLTFMECYYDILSFCSTSTGRLVIDGKSVDFSDGRAYLEKNWGTSFPQKWIWAQAQHFSTYEPLSLTLSVALIPFLGFHFLGFMTAFSHDGRVYRFTTYNHSRIKSLVNGDGSIEIVFVRRKDELRVVLDKSTFVPLNAPRMGNMTKECLETLNTSIKLSFYQRGTLRIKSESSPAALEINPPDFAL